MNILPVFLLFLIGLISHQKPALVKAEEVFASVDDKDETMNKLMARYLSRSGPREITVPGQDAEGTYLNMETTGGAFHEGWYVNTTRVSED